MRIILGIAAALTAVSFVVSAHADADKRIKLVNETRHAMTAFYASRVGTDDWEEDILGVDVLAVGESVVVNFGGEDYCLYDFRAEFDDGEVIEKERIDVCELDVYRYTED